MINKSNIRNYIDFLHYKKYDIGAKEELLERWTELSDFEIIRQLTGLYQHWDIPMEVAQRYEQAFLDTQAPKAEAVAVAIPEPVATHVEPEVAPDPIGTKRSKYPLIIIAVLLALAAAGGTWYYLHRQQEELSVKATELQQKQEQVAQAQAKEDEARAKAAEEAQAAAALRASQLQEVRTHVSAYVKTRATYDANNTFGGIKDVVITLNNTSDFKLDEAKVLIDYIRKNGEVHETEQVVFYNVPPHTQKSMSGPSSGRGTQVNLRVSSVQVSDQ